MRLHAPCVYPGRQARPTRVRRCAIDTRRCCGGGTEAGTTAGVRTSSVRAPRKLFTAGAPRHAAPPLPLLLKACTTGAVAAGAGGAAEAAAAAAATAAPETAAAAAAVGASAAPPSPPFIPPAAPAGPPPSPQTSPATGSCRRPPARSCPQKCTRRTPPRGGEQGPPREAPNAIPRRGPEGLGWRFKKAGTAGRWPLHPQHLPHHVWALDGSGGAVSGVNGEEAVHVGERPIMNGSDRLRDRHPRREGPATGGDVNRRLRAGGVKEEPRRGGPARDPRRLVVLVPPHVQQRPRHGTQRGKAGPAAAAVARGTQVQPPPLLRPVVPHDGRPPDGQPLPRRHQPHVCRPIGRHCGGATRRRRNVGLQQLPPTVAVHVIAPQLQVPAADPWEDKLPGPEQHLHIDDNIEGVGGGDKGEGRPRRAPTTPRRRVGNGGHQRTAREPPRMVPAPQPRPRACRGGKLIERRVGDVGLARPQPPPPAGHVRRRQRFL
ncbi:hypothetical protein BU14_0154s0026 [Porphyra umbilicalis]|uniref:Uncharacterized protein n=1 Tax=Porphyra umbilicalis TaxID=2786 RepID=A0A1X6P8M5_PORUM|nr:hypothetical protein BU14_0154s0026 [Porphyra umbilicalis]|eukprot:OSX77249.1 hypothetical protein BU14_0154s0026 [Porphyra umbilicalis]